MSWSFTSPGSSGKFALQVRFRLGFQKGRSTTDLTPCTSRWLTWFAAVVGLTELCPAAIQQTQVLPEILHTPSESTSVGQELTSLIPAQPGLPVLAVSPLMQPKTESLGGIRLLPWTNIVPQWFSRELYCCNSTGTFMVCLSSA